ncbi:MAG: B12-binding domain-containing protein [Thermoanaerobaculia bacterium]
MLDDVLASYHAALIDTDRRRAFEVVHEALDRGVTPEEIVFSVVIPAIDLTTKKVREDGELSLAQQIMGSQIGAAIVEEMVPRFSKKPEVVGRIVLGTSAGDFHGLGKRIVAGCLKARMIDVSDLGLNVTAERFVDEALTRDAHVIGISSMMVHTARGENGARKVRQILKQRGLEEKLRIIVGGAAYRWDHDLYKSVEADAWAENGILAGDVVCSLIREVRK